jgi:uncharacterized membrane protein YedE/YeeE
MYEQFGIEWLSPTAASALLGLTLGVVFGAISFRTRFCLRRALVSTNTSEKLNAVAVWLTALGVALVGTQLSVFAGWIDFSEHRFHATDLPLALLALGGILFGVGMVLTRGCASRMSTLAGSGNIRAIIVLLVFAVTAHSTLKGVLSPLRTELADFTIDVSQVSAWMQSPVFTVIAVLFSFAVVAAAAINSNTSKAQLLGGALIGLLVPLGWIGTGWVLQDDFDPIVFQSLSFTSPSADWLFWSIASTSVGAGFGVGLLFGVFFGSAATALITREFEWVSFSSPAQTGRYLSGAILMGVGGVLAGGCTVGAGLSGVSSLSFSALLSLVFIVFGALATDYTLRRKETVVLSGNGAASLAS